MQLIIAVPVTGAMVLRAYARQSLTPLGIVAAVATAAAHAVHPWSVFFTLLIAFFMAGTYVTKVCFRSSLVHDDMANLLDLCRSSTRSRQT